MAGKTRGKCTWFPGKEQSPVTTNLTTPSHESLDRVQQFIELQQGHVSRSDLMEYAWRTVMKLPVPKDLKTLITQAQQEEITVG